MKKHCFFSVFLITVFLLTSCTKWDEYKQYTTSGETFYTGKMDSIKIFSGRLRVKITGLLPADPKITKTKITWNNDSVVYSITKGVGIDTFSKIINVPEGVINFTIQNFDAAGNASLPVTASGTAYDVKYESGLINRPVVQAELQTSGNTVVTWDVLDTTTGAKGTWVSFTKANDTKDSIYVPVSQATTTIPGLKAFAPITLRTRYLPTSTALDTFSTGSQSRNVRVDISPQYLSNTGPGFARATFDGRWGTLAAPWVTNAAAKNKGGGANGGYSSDAGGVINWETWTNTPVVNGIVYQPTASALPAGSYTVQFDEYSEIQSNSTVYCIAAAGGTGIPILSGLSTALGSVGLYNGAAVNTTSPSVTDTRSFTFTLATPQIISIGFLGNIAGGAPIANTTNFNPGSYFQVKRIQLFKN